MELKACSGRLDAPTTAYDPQWNVVLRRKGRLRCLLYRQRPQVRRIHHIRSRSQMFVARNRICVARARTNLLMDGGGPRSGIVVGINVTLPRPTARTGTRNPQDLSRQTGA
jgi:hypothetical protein